jgi:hypothetical protein
MEAPRAAAQRHGDELDILCDIVAIGEVFTSSNQHKKKPRFADAGNKDTDDSKEVLVVIGRERDAAK